MSDAQETVPIYPRGELPGDRLATAPGYCLGLAVHGPELHPEGMSSSGIRSSIPAFPCADLRGMSSGATRPCPLEDPGAFPKQLLSFSITE